jgi:hypothetical protein
MNYGEVDRIMRGVRMEKGRRGREERRLYKGQSKRITHQSVR